MQESAPKQNPDAVVQRYLARAIHKGKQQTSKLLQLAAAAARQPKQPQPARSSKRGKGQAINQQEDKTEDDDLGFPRAQVVARILSSGFP